MLGHDVDVGLGGGDASSQVGIFLLKLAQALHEEPDVNVNTRGRGRGRLGRRLGAGAPRNFALSVGSIRHVVVASAGESLSSDYQKDPERKRCGFFFPFARILLLLFFFVFLGELCIRSDFVKKTNTGATTTT